MEVITTYTLVVAMNVGEYLDFGWAKFSVTLSRVERRSDVYRSTKKINNVSLLINQLSYHKFQRKKIINQLSYHKSTEKKSQSFLFLVNPRHPIG